MKKASEYRENAKECRQLAKTATSAEHRQMLENMAQTWESLANDRAARILREQRLRELEKAAGISDRSFEE